MDVKKIKVLKFCGKCRLEKPLEDFHTDSSTKHGVKGQCKDCMNHQGFYNRQKRLARRLGVDPHIKRCSCGNLYNEKTGGGVRKNLKTLCSICEKKNPLIKVYVTELKKSVWVRLPSGYGKLL